MNVSDLPAGTALAALRFEHFPTRWQAALRALESLLNFYILPVYSRI